MPERSAFNFEEFDERGAQSATTPLVTVQKSGILSFNRAAFEALGEPDEVKLLYDRGRKVIGIRPAAPEEPSTYRMREQSRSSGRLVTGLAFFHRFDIPLGESRRYRAELLEDGVLAVDLTGEPVGGRQPAASEKRGKTGRQTGAR